MTPPVRMGAGWGQRRSPGVSAWPPVSTAGCARGKIDTVTDPRSDPSSSVNDSATTGSSFADSIDLDYYELGADVTALSDDIEVLRTEIDRLDAIILAAVRRRSAVSKKVGAARMASGGPRLVHSREVKVLDRFAELGQEGHTLAMLLLRLGRGPLGR